MFRMKSSYHNKATLLQHNFRNELYRINLHKIFQRKNKKAIDWSYVSNIMENVGHSQDWNSEPDSAKRLQPLKTGEVVFVYFLCVVSELQKCKLGTLQTFILYNF